MNDVGDSNVTLEILNFIKIFFSTLPYFKKPLYISFVNSFVSPVARTSVFTGHFTF